MVGVAILLWKFSMKVFNESLLWKFSKTPKISIMEILLTSFEPEVQVWVKNETNYKLTTFGRLASDKQ